MVTNVFEFRGKGKTRRHAPPFLPQLLLALFARVQQFEKSSLTRCLTYVKPFV